MRLFIAIWPSQKAIDAISLLDKSQKDGIRWVLPQNWHITLSFLGEIDLEIALRHFNCIQTPNHEIHACLGPETKLIKNRILYIPAQGLKSLFESVYDSTKEITHSPPDPLAHLTLARCRNPKEELANLTEQKISIYWSVPEITLVASTLEPTGATYKIIARRTMSLSHS